MADRKTHSSRVMSLFNQSGGVGKSTLTMNLGYHLAHRKYRVLLIDLDPQSSLTTFMGLEPLEIQKTLYDALLEDEPLPIHKDIHGVDLAPANINLSGAELELVTADMREQRMKDAIAPVLQKYDFILIDCPPSLGILSYISLVASTHVLIPIQTQYKAFQGTDLLFRTIKRVRARPNRQLKIAGYLPTMFAKGNSQDQRILCAIQDQFDSVEGIIFPEIPRTTAFADATEKHIPLALHNPKHPAVTILETIAEMLEGIK
ncbi:ParA family protein [Cyanobacteria bacterium FACHB-472]|nr:ParA family protein [Cyanobacteria bacterium FACHB-472]